MMNTEREARMTFKVNISFFFSQKGEMNEKERKGYERKP